MQLKCEGCAFYRAGVSSLSPVSYKSGLGECRRNAPRGPVQLAWSKGDDEVHRVTLSPFPLVPFDDWCGEHSATKGEMI